MLRYIAATAVAVILTTSPRAHILPFPASFHMQMVQTNGTSLYVRVGGLGPAVVLLHGFGDTGDMWAPLAAVLAKDHTVIVPDLRGMGLSAHPDTGYAEGRPRDPRHRQYGGVCAGGAVPGAYYTMGCDRCAYSRNRRLGQHHPQPSFVALQLPWSR